MISIQQAIEELQGSEIIRDDGSPAMCTAGELVILLDRLQHLESLTKETPLTVTLKRQRPGPVALEQSSMLLNIVTPIDVDKGDIELAMRLTRGIMEEMEEFGKVPNMGSLAITAIDKICRSNGWRYESQPSVIPASIDLFIDFTDGAGEEPDLTAQ